MSRQDRMLTDREEMIGIIDRGEVIHIGMHDGDDIYIVPMNYGYTWVNGALTFYLHGALEGKKIRLLKQNPRVGFAVDYEHELVEGKVPCQYGYKFASVIGHGDVEFIEEPREKIKAMEILMRQYTDRAFEFNEKLMTIVAMFKIRVTDFTGRARK